MGDTGTQAKIRRDGQLFMPHPRWLGASAVMFSIVLNSLGLWLLTRSDSTPQKHVMARTLELTSAVPLSPAMPSLPPSSEPPPKPKPLPQPKAKPKTVVMAPTPQTSASSDLIAAPEPAPIELPMATVDEIAPSRVAQTLPVAPAPVEMPPIFDAAYLKNPEPEYPRAAKRLGIQGTVLLHVMVGADGKAKEVSVAESSGSALLDDAAVAAVRAWSFVPARRGDEVIAAAVYVPLRFTLNRG